MAMSMDEAIALVNLEICGLEVGPEQVTAADPAQTPVDWDDRPAQARRLKMLDVRSVVRCKLPLHQMPEVLLVAEDGAVTSLFEWNVGTQAS
jgi:hypothetical protein